MNISGLTTVTKSSKLGAAPYTENLVQIRMIISLMMWFRLEDLCWVTKAHSLWNGLVF